MARLFGGECFFPIATLLFVWLSNRTLGMGAARGIRCASRGLHTFSGRRAVGTVVHRG
jgi:hypothetical protein